MVMFVPFDGERHVRFLCARPTLIRCLLILLFDVLCLVTILPRLFPELTSLLYGPVFQTVNMNIQEFLLKTVKL